MREGSGGPGVEPSSGARLAGGSCPAARPSPGGSAWKHQPAQQDDRGLHGVTSLLIVGAPALVLMWTVYLVSMSTKQENKIAKRQALPGRHWWWSSEAPS